MELIHIIVLVSAFSSVSCDYYNKNPCYLPSNEVALKIYGVYLMGFTILIMALVIIFLSIALYMLINNKSICGIHIQRKSYLRQESNHGVTLCTIPSSNNLCDRCKNGSTLTVNSGIVEIGGLNEPETPTTRYDEKHGIPRMDRITQRMDDNPIILPKKTMRPIPQNPMAKEQMDEIISAVLKRKQKSESATFRELDAIAKPKSEKLGVNDVSSPGSKSGSLKKLDSRKNSDENLYQNSKDIKNDTKPDLKIKITDEDVKKEPVKIRTLERNKDIVDGSKNVETKLPVDDDELEVYDTLPSPVKCDDLDPESEDFIKNMPVYDLPPSRRSLESNEDKTNIISKDTDTYYLLPLSRDLDDEESCYVNAKIRDKQ